MIDGLIKDYPTTPHCRTKDGHSLRALRGYHSCPVSAERKRTSLVPSVSEELFRKPRYIQARMRCQYGSGRSRAGRGPDGVNALGCFSGHIQSLGATGTMKTMKNCSGFGRMPADINQAFCDEGRGRRGSLMSGNSAFTLQGQVRDLREFGARKVASMMEKNDGVTGRFF